MERLHARLTHSVLAFATFLAMSLTVALFSSADVAGRTDQGTCSETAQKACITAHSSYAGKACTSGAGSDCITCQHDPGSVCTWTGGDIDGYKDDETVIQ
jgi:hypothetical protein